MSLIFRGGEQLTAADVHMSRSFSTVLFPQSRLGADGELVTSVPGCSGKWFCY